MRHSQCDVLLTCCTVILRFEDGRIKEISCIEMVEVRAANTNKP